MAILTMLVFTLVVAGSAVFVLAAALQEGTGRSADVWMHERLTRARYRARMLARKRAGSANPHQRRQGPTTGGEPGCQGSGADTTDS